MGIPIYTKNGYNGGVFIDNNYKFDKSFFTNNDIENIVTAFYILKGLTKNKNDNMLYSILQKLCTIFPNEILLKERDLLEYFKIELLEKPIILNERIFNIVNDALDLERAISIIYENKNIVVLPLYYILRIDGLYLEVFYNNSKIALYFEKIEECILTKKEFDRKKILYK